MLGGALSWVLPWPCWVARMGLGPGSQTGCHAAQCAHACFSGQWIYDCVAWACCSRLGFSPTSSRGGLPSPWTCCTAPCRLCSMQPCARHRAAVLPTAPSPLLSDAVHLTPHCHCRPCCGTTPCSISCRGLGCARHVPTSMGTCGSPFPCFCINVHAEPKHKCFANAKNMHKCV